MVKQTVLPMSGIFSSQRFGKPQIFAAALLLVFVGECAWLVAHEYPNATGEDELARVEEGLAQWHGLGIAGTPSISHLCVWRVSAYTMMSDDEVQLISKPADLPCWMKIAGGRVARRNSIICGVMSA